MIQSSLVDVQDCVLIVIDVQTAVLEKLDPAQSDPLLQRINWLIWVAQQLAVPLVVTAEDSSQLGGVDPQIQQQLSSDTIIHNKMVFGLASDPQILGAVEETGRRTAVLIGLETDVCIAHSAIGLLERGYAVVVVEDATGSPAEAHAQGLARIRGAGGVVLSLKQVFYEWTRTVELCNRIRALSQSAGFQDPVVL